MNVEILRYNITKAHFISILITVHQALVLHSSCVLKIVGVDQKSY